MTADMAGEGGRKRRKPKGRCRKTNRRSGGGSRRDASPVRFGANFGLATLSGEPLALALPLRGLRALPSPSDSKGQRVLVITQDGRTIVGELQGFDQTTNVILASSTERVYSLEEGVEEVPLGVYIVRGDNISLIGLVDPEADAQVDLSAVRAEPIGEVVH
ncbi:SPOSA6832_04251, partial [Sporobolomyces salmonicolor]